MELKNHWQIIKKYRWLIISAAILLMIAGFLIGLPQQAKFETTISFDILSLNNINSPEDTYYLMQKNQMVGDTLMSWTITPDIVNSIFAKSNIIPVEHGINLENYFRAKRYSPQNIVIKFVTNDEVMAKKLANNLITVFQEKSTGIKNFQISPSKPIIINKKVDFKLYGTIGLFAGLLSGTLLSYLLWYLKEK